MTTAGTKDYGSIPDRLIRLIEKKQARPHNDGLGTRRK